MRSAPATMVATADAAAARRCRSGREQARARGGGAEAAVQRADARRARAHAPGGAGRAELRRSRAAGAPGLRLRRPRRFRTTFGVQAARQGARCWRQQRARHVAEQRVRHRACARSMAARAPAGAAGRLPLRSPVGGPACSSVTQAVRPRGCPRRRRCWRLATSRGLEIVDRIADHRGRAGAARCAGAASNAGEGPARPKVGRTVRRSSPAAFTKVSALGVEEQRVNVLIEIMGPAARGRRSVTAIASACASCYGREEVSSEVPAGALFRRDGGWSVFIVEQGRARSRAVTYRSSQPRRGRGPRRA